MTTLKDHAAEARSLTRDQFVARHPAPALILATSAIAGIPKLRGPSTGSTETKLGLDPVGELALPSKDLDEDPAMGATTVTHAKDVFRVAAPPVLDPLSTVYFVQKSPRNPFASMITMGRARNNDIALDIPTVSKLHAYFTTRGEAFRLHDQGSTNGTVLNGRPLMRDEAAPVPDDALIELAPGVTLRFKQPRSFYDFLKTSKF